METRHAGQLQTALDAMEELDDAGIHALIAQAQGLLLDRPGPGDGTPQLTVEVVERREGELLARYRALAPFAQRRVQRHVMRLLRTSHRYSAPDRPGAVSLSRIEKDVHACCLAHPGEHARHLSKERWENRTDATAE